MKTIEYNKVENLSKAYFDPNSKWLFSTIFTIPYNYTVKIKAVKLNDTYHIYFEKYMDKSFKEWFEIIVKDNKAIVNIINGFEIITVNFREDDLLDYIAITVYIVNKDNYIDIFIPTNNDTIDLNNIYNDLQRIIEKDDPIGEFIKTYGVLRKNKTPTYSIIREAFLSLLKSKLHFKLVEEENKENN